MFCDLVPAGSLAHSTSYTICLTADIRHVDGAHFDGFMAQFVTGAGMLTVGGTVEGLEGGELVVLQNNAADDLTVAVDGAFTFPTAVADGGAYDVTVKTQPDNQHCTVASGSGTVSGEAVTGVRVVCHSPWARTAVVASNVSYCSKVTSDGEGNLYIGGYVTNDGDFDFGSGVINGAFGAGSNAVIVKYLAR